MVRRIAVNSSGIIYVGTLDGGLSISADGIGGLNIQGLFLDSLGKVYVATGGGLAISR